MANYPNFSNVTFAGDYFDEVFGPMVLDPAGLLENELVTPIDGSKFKETINEISDTVALKDPTAAFADQGTTEDVDEVNVSLVPYEFHKEISLASIRNSWMSGKLKSGSLNDYEYGPLVAQYVQDVYVPKLKLAQNFLVLNGKTGLDSTVGTLSGITSYTGLYSRFNSSGNVRKQGLSGTTGNNITIESVTKGTTTILTLPTGSNATDKLFAGNIISIRGVLGTGWVDDLNVDCEILAVNSDTEIEVDVDTDGLTSIDYTGDSGRIRYINRTNIVPIMEGHISRMRAEVRRRQDVKIAMPTHLEYEWQFANAAANINGNADYVRTAYQMQFIDKRIVVLDDAPANTIAAWPQERVFYAFDLSDDYSTVEVLWQGATGDKVYRLRGAMKTGTGISTKYANQITLTTPES